MKSLKFVLLGLSILLYSNLQAGILIGDSVAPKENWKVIKEKGYMLSYPSHWLFNAGSKDGIAFTMYAPGPKAFGGYEENLNLSIHDLAEKNMDLNTYTRLSERQIHTLISNSNMILSERIDTIDDAFHQIVYTGDYNEQVLKWKMRFWVVKDKVYILTYTATKEKFGLHIKAAEEIMDTFKLR